ncbi:proline racemase [Aspergillus japonicus CBS 114.51]|uniref:Proline racemase n=2 Tax=Aspergillus TaxID=5052 RepID=A0A2V5H7Q2_ASPV1|nr:proline racemase [Aspergillus japonicus CBS 114.51]PYI16953.1 proline racemase [Aspergillus violaceofuscus CBS 115571]RAH78809.1 proline racemase [Aspergillus japonicus CBS 114.51]
MVHSNRAVHIVSVHSAGEIGDVIVGGVLDVPGQTMFDKMTYFRTQADELRQLLLNEPRGRPSRNVNLVLPACDPRADAGFLIMESQEYAYMSGSNTICTATALLETGMVKMQEPTTMLRLDTAAGLVAVTAECEAGKCKSVAFDNVPAFVFHLNLAVDVPGLGTILCDVAYGGMMYAIVDMAQTNLTMDPDEGQRIVEYGERIKRAVQAAVHPVHPDNPGIHGVTNFIFTTALVAGDGPDGGKKAQNAVVVSPGRLDRSPCGTGTCARMAQLHARQQLAVGEPFVHTSIIGTEYVGSITGTVKVGEYDAILPRVKGSAWITSFQQVVLDPTDPFPQGFRVGDAWHVSKVPVPAGAPVNSI